MKVRLRNFLCAWAILINSAHSKEQKPIHEILDLQMHATIHEPYGFFGKGLTWLPSDKKEAAKIESSLTHQHTFKNIMYADFYKKNSGSRIIVNGALAGEVAFTRKQARKLILDQINYINKVVADNPETFILAKTPQEVRWAVHNTDKTVVVHSIEGARKLIATPEDAQFWASKGVAFITLIHLLDDEFGASAISKDGITPLINLRGTLRRWFKPRKNRGLTDLGKKAIKWIADAGMLIDLTHMHPDSKNDALDIMEKEGIPPLLTHTHFKPFQDHERGMTKEQLVRVYKLGGLFSLPNSGDRLKLINPTEEAKEYLANKEFCPGTYDNYLHTFNFVNEFLKTKIPELYNAKNFEELNENEKIDFSLGFQSDFNGWVDHGHPRHGDKGCIAIKPNQKLNPVQVRGLAHPGLLPQYWSLLESRGMEVDSIRRSSEKFLRMWGSVRKRTEREIKLPPSHGNILDSHNDRIIDNLSDDF